MEGSVRPDRISIGPDCVDCVDCVEGSASMNGSSEVELGSHCLGICVAVSEVLGKF